MMPAVLFHFIAKVYRCGEPLKTQTPTDGSSGIPFEVVC